MAVVQMRRISIYALKKDRKTILETLQRRGVVEINDVLQEDSVFQKTDMTASKSQFEKNIEAGRQALDVLNRFSPEKKSLFSSFQGREEVQEEAFHNFSKKRDEILQAVFRVNGLAKDLAEAKAAKQKLETQCESLVPWQTLDVSMRTRSTKAASVFIGTLNGEFSAVNVEEKLAELVPGVPVYCETVSSSPEQTCIFLLCPLAHGEITEDALRSLSFAFPPSPSKNPPAERLKNLRERIVEWKEKETALEKGIKEFAPMRGEFRFLVDYLSVRLEKYKVIEQLVQSRRTFVLTGYVPEPAAQNLQELLTHEYDAAVELEIPDDDAADVPVLLRNNGFAAPVEGIVESYSLPNRKEVDPSSIMALFYYALFGMMLGDAAYGLLMVAGCGLALWKFKGMEPGLKRSVKMFFFCGISTTIWGFLFGSFFGDAVAVISSTFFHSDNALKAIWFEPLSDPMRLLLFSLLVGIIHLFTGLGVQLYELVKQRKFKDAIYDVVFWYLLVGGLIVLLMTTDMFFDLAKFKFSLPSLVVTVLGIVIAAAALGIICTAGRESRNPFKRFLKGLYGLYNVSGYLSDILSYSRLLALGLATSVIANVVNKMGAMGGDGVVGVIMFLVVFLAGHTLNIGINMLGAYVHTNRLQFVEFFGKFYQGGGRKFRPFAFHTKYYKIREEKDHG